MKSMLDRLACVSFAFGALLFLPSCRHESTAPFDANNCVTSREAPTECSRQFPRDIGKFSEGNDCSVEFQQQYGQFRLGMALPTDLRNVRVLVVHGLLGEVGLQFTNFLDQFDHNQRLIGYLKDQRQALECDGADITMLCYRSDTVERCGAIVAQCIRTSDKPVIIISHSKGCLDTLDALLRLQRENNLSQVAGWLAIQGPFEGAPGADEVSRSKFRSLTTRVTFKCLGARFDAVKDMTSGARKSYLENHRDEIGRVVASVPIVCFASLNDKAKRPGTDGSVAVNSAILPATDYAVLHGVSHSTTVMGGNRSFDRIAFTRALVSMLFERIKSQRN